MDPKHATANVMVVGDHPFTVRLITSMLKRGGYRRSHSAADTPTALTLYEILAPDLLVLDFHAADGVAAAVLHAVSKREGVRTPLLLLVPEGLANQVARWAVRVGVGEVLAKPFDQRGVCASVQRSLEHRPHKHPVEHTLHPPAPAACSCACHDDTTAVLLSA
jgi:CheY-like chemotaxis protein